MRSPAFFGSDHMASAAGPVVTFLFSIHLWASETLLNSTKAKPRETPTGREKRQTRLALKSGFILSTQRDTIRGHWIRDTTFSFFCVLSSSWLLNSPRVSPRHCQFNTLVVRRGEGGIVVFREVFYRDWRIRISHYGVREISGSQ